jgi:hypothetical protein
MLTSRRAKRPNQARALETAAAAGGAPCARAPAAAGRPAALATLCYGCNNCKGKVRPPLDAQDQICGPVHMLLPRVHTPCFCPTPLRGYPGPDVQPVGATPHCEYTGLFTDNTPPCTPLRAPRCHSRAAPSSVRQPPPAPRARPPPPARCRAAAGRAPARAKTPPPPPDAVCPHIRPFTSHPRPLPAAHFRARRRHRRIPSAPEGQRPPPPRPRHAARARPRARAAAPPPPPTVRRAGAPASARARRTLMRGAGARSRRAPAPRGRIVRRAARGGPTPTGPRAGAGASASRARYKHCTGPPRGPGPRRARARAPRARARHAKTRAGRPPNTPPPHPSALPPCTPHRSHPLASLAWPAPRSSLTRCRANFCNAPCSLERELGRPGREAEPRADGGMWIARGQPPPRAGPGALAGVAGQGALAGRGGDEPHPHPTPGLGMPHTQPCLRTVARFWSKPLEGAASPPARCPAVWAGRRPGRRRAAAAGCARPRRARPPLTMQTRRACAAVSNPPCAAPGAPRPPPTPLSLWRSGSLGLPDLAPRRRRTRPRPKSTLTTCTPR